MASPRTTFAHLSANLKVLDLKVMLDFVVRDELGWIGHFRASTQVTRAYQRSFEVEEHGAFKETVQRISVGATQFRDGLCLKILSETGKAS